MLNHLKHNKISFFISQILLLNLWSPGWTTDYMVKDCNCITFSVVLAMTVYAFQIENRYPYQLAAVISFCTWGFPRVIKVIA
jgi:hypothetical protein